MINQVTGPNSLRAALNATVSAGVIGLFSVLFNYSAHIAEAGYLLLPAKKALEQSSEKENKNLTKNQWVSARQSALKAWEAFPEDPSPPSVMAMLYLERTRRLTDPEIAKIYAEEAVVWATRSKNMRPTNPWATAFLALAKAEQGASPQEVLMLWEQANKCARYEFDVQILLLSTATRLKGNEPGEINMWRQQMKRSQSGRLRGIVQ
ncbi:hypothetical protein [Aquabacterium sp.]|uniref:hypothetical protein n=1 Tax=Aquabacterium sp. TaxID=1872578 RepID=UPI0035B27A49